MTIETEETIVIYGSPEQGSVPMHCPACRRQVAMVTPGAAARTARVSPRTVYRWVEENAVHFIESCGHLLICVVSLPHGTAARSGEADSSENSEGKSR